MTASIPVWKGPNNPDVSSRSSGRLNDGRIRQDDGGLVPGEEGQQASARDVDRSELPKKDAVGDRPSEPEEEEEEEEELPPEIAPAMDDYGGGGSRGARRTVVEARRGEARRGEARQAPRIKKARALRGCDSPRRRCLSTTSANDDDDDAARRSDDDDDDGRVKNRTSTLRLLFDT
jgi:hypothetical protein